jgi:Ca2+-binding EF-hand superfamily protein
MMLKRIGLAALFVAALPLAAVAGKAGDRSFRAMDSDGDGKLSADEHSAGAARMFEQMDADRDGKVTADEMTAAHDRVAGRHARKSPMSSADKIKVLDTDGDGALSAAEHAAGAKMMFDRMDTDEDGFVTPAESAAGHRKYLEEGKSAEGKPAPQDR